MRDELGELPLIAEDLGNVSMDEVLRALSDIARASAPGDRVLVVLVGHGTAQGGDVRFNLPGPDLSPADLDAALDGLAGRRLAVVVTTPSSVRRCCQLSATASGAEFQHTRFGGFFIEALGGEDADADKDRRVSLLEAFDYARRRVQQAYRSEQRLQPEHALLEDNGDGQGSREPGAGPGADGALAARFRFEPPAAAEPGADPAQQGRLAALQVSARRLVDAVERLRRDRRLISEQAYLERLEGLLVELALNRRAWREAGGS